ncbi:MAG: DNA photolyase family protein [Gammaproteobacteria bacterium]|nr:DNA photolyase family protein [Gammaproteobacteria bacterium]
MTVQIVWFKRDLRLADHAPFVAAAARGPVLPLYVIEPAAWEQPDASFRHARFIRDCLLDLDAALRSLGGQLIVREGEITVVLESLRRELGGCALWSHEETGNAWSYVRDRQLAAWCRAQGVTWVELPTNGVIRRLRDRDGWAAKRDAVMRTAPLPVPPSPTFATCASLPVTLQIDEAIGAHLSPAGQPPAAGVACHVQAGGRREALKVLDSFLDSRSSRYMRTISRPGVSARHCSRLSAHLAWGSLSVREVDQATAARIDELTQSPDPGSDDWARQLQAFRSRLAWRCHFVQKLEQQPAIELRCMHPAFEGMRESAFNEDFFVAWSQGRTGYPLVDACMRSLHANGWITFRMRAMLVAFASYHLWLDWRRTAPVLARLFTDYEPGIHYSQFQMQSGVTGINAVRIYNPIKQSHDHDPDGKFIRRYVPELRDLPGEFIHEPWQLAEPPADYPAPIVEHETAAREARRRMTPYWRGEGFRDGAQAVFRKLGSRNRPRESRRARSRTAAKPDPTPQLDLGFGEPPEVRKT